MNLTSLNRALEAMGISLGTTDTALTNSLNLIISAVSKQIENSPFFFRYAELKARTEDFDIEARQKLVSVRAVPILATPTPLVYNDEDREFALATLIDDDDYGINYNRGIFTFDNYDLVAGNGALRITYTGGLGLHTDRMIVTAVTGGTGSYTADEEVTGQTSGARGKYVSLSGVTLTVSVLSGEFVTGEIIKGNTSSTVRTISAITQNPIVMAYPDIALACELQSMFIQKRRQDIGLGSESMQGGSISINKSFQLLPEVVDLLSPYRVR